VEVTRGYLESKYEVLRARQALDLIESFGATLHGATPEVDSLCPGLQAELHKFREMARKHYKELDPDLMSGSDEDQEIKKKDKRAIQKERSANRDAKYENAEP